MASHKRTSSSAENTTKAPGTKRRVANPETSVQTASNTSRLEHVYVVIVHTIPGYNDLTSKDISGVYVTIEDANNCVRNIANYEYSATEDFRHGRKGDGRIWWKADDVGEGDAIEIWIEKHELKGPGSEPKCDFENGGEFVEGSEEESEDAEDFDGDDDEE